MTLSLREDKNMAYTITVSDGNKAGAIRKFAESLFESNDIHGALVPCRQPVKNRIMPTLVADREHLNAFAPISPVFPMNAARMVARLTRKSTGKTIAAFLRPCELRAFVELVKLKQGGTNDVILIGMDCPGAFINRDADRFMNEHGDNALELFSEKTKDGPWKSENGYELMASCRICEHPVAEACDIHIGFMGTGGSIMVHPKSGKGEKLLAVTRDGMAVSAEELIKKRSLFLDDLIRGNTSERDAVFEKTEKLVGGIEKLSDYLSGCVNCYNCRVACPVCYCRECVFVTDVFEHEPSRYLKWAERKGALKMPSDTVFYHITRTAHMSTACVGCGQCSNACPNDIPVMELFRYTAHAVQNAFGYEAGRDLDEKPPLSEFRENEFSEIVGIHAA